jgi:hypothetical protein
LKYLKIIGKSWRQILYVVSALAIPYLYSLNEIFPESKEYNGYVLGEGSFPDWFTFIWFLVCSFIPMFAGFIGVVTSKWHKHQVPKITFFTSLLIFGSILTEDTISSSESFTWFNFYSLDIVLPAALILIGLSIAYLSRNSPEAELERLKSQLDNLDTKSLIKLETYIQAITDFNRDKENYKSDEKVRTVTDLALNETWEALKDVKGTIKKVQYEK